VAHPDANIIFGNVIDDALGDTVRVTVIAAGFDHFDSAPSSGTTRTAPEPPPARTATRTDATEPAESDLVVPRRGASKGRDVFDVGGDDDLDLDDDFDVPSFLR
jgi:cell division protein FtsZ